MKRLFSILLVIFGAAASIMAQSAKFNLSAGAHSVSGWTNVVGDPSQAVISVTSSSGITISSVGTANWVPYGSGSAFDAVGENVNGFFPAAVMYNHWYQYGSTAEYNAAGPQFLSAASARTVRILLPWPGAAHPL